ncbi:hypothetical protein D3C75_1149480 [compost metagenome]
MVFQALGGSFAALSLFGFSLSDPFLVALFVVHGFLHACAALRGRMRAINDRRNRNCQVGLDCVCCLGDSQTYKKLSVAKR